MIWYDMTLKNFKLVLPRESGRLPFLMMMALIWLIIKGFIDVSTAHDDEDLDTNFFYQNLRQNLT